MLTLTDVCLVKIDEEIEGRKKRNKPPLIIAKISQLRPKRDVNVASQGLTSTFRITFRLFSLEKPARKSASSRSKPSTSRPCSYSRTVTSSPDFGLESWPIMLASIWTVKT